MTYKKLTSIASSLVLMVILSVSTYVRAENNPVFQEAVNAYEQGQFDSAKEKFSQLLPDNHWAFAALYNLGNVAVRQKRLGEAAAYFRRALQIKPADWDTRFNLKYTLTNLGIVQFPGGKGTWELMRAEILNTVTADQILAATWVVFFFVLFNLYKYLKGKKVAKFNEEAVPRVPIIMLVWGFLFLCLGATAVCKIYDSYSDRATIISHKIDLRSGPGDANASLIELSEGFEVLVQEDVNGWKQVSALDGPRVGLTGWVPSSALMLTSGGGPW